ncbi:vacuolar protein sorting-associated protein 37A-like [Mercenaria mercenaria]|uniref:vacuolar protein sorting-associated protein 37A-like n=1 Tax=Mercenaria mercenaria TaxID=6596 RepID=UPI001E1D26EC|nr:vacuolar protein sorting-associated protein 37A-like [Mercenaria mercenaria]XP_045205162.1 vacuolar protein sorting-associated protein 37A-like [Mercenaria mercenaria]
MPWFGQGGKKGKLPGATELQVQRTKQIESLRRGNLNVIETLRDVEYRLTIQAAGNSLTLIINLPPQFPQDKPSITVQPAVRHPWVDSNSKVINCPNINNFSVHSSLNTAVQAVVDEFRSNPPALVSHVQYPVNTPNRGYPSMFPVTTNIFSIYPSMPSYTSPASPTETTTSPSQNATSTTETQLSNCDTSIPDFSQTNIMSTFPELKDKGRLEMLEILNEEEKILEIIQKMPQVQQVVQEREKQSCKCTELAKENLSKKPVIEDLKQQVSEMMQEFESLRTQFESNQEKQCSLIDQFHPSVIQNNLKVAILEAEEESEKIVEDFLDKKIDIEEFTTQFLEKRALYHTRRAKEEKMNHMSIDQGF